ncbi:MULTISPECIES: hypothetical protein [Flavobacteriaceae]|uniref:hypothetical protein n=1 Tax=Flavobacteriaceae TaxID=49546 RepID=UPI001492320F|nr:MULTISPECIES: hypothetical protein [Allomuricauda]MDC6367211.1 hypothetical protein [Muricauda sp. AC10]
MSEKILEHQQEVEAHFDSLVAQRIITKREAQSILKSEYPFPLILEKEKIDSDLKQELKFFKDRTTPLSIYLSKHFGKGIMDSVISEINTDNSPHSIVGLDQKIRLSEDHSLIHFGFSSPIRLDNEHYLLFMFLKKYRPTWNRDKRAYIVKCDGYGRIITEAEFYIWHP